MKNNIWKLYLIVFFHNLIPAYVIERIFSAERGLTIQQVVYCEMIYAAVVVLLEIPSGILSDRWGRKKVLLISGLLAVLEFLILIRAFHFSYFAFVAFLAGISGALSSGTQHALLYDSLKAAGLESDYESILGRMNVIDYTAVVLAALSGGLMANRFNLELNYWISALSMLLSFFLIYTLQVPSRALAEAF